MTPADAMHAARTDPRDPSKLTATSGRPRHRAHWSPRAARRDLRAFQMLAFRGTTLQLHSITGSMAIHSDIHGVRCYCEEEGICTHEAAVRRTYVGATEDGPNGGRGHRIYRYHLHRLVIQAIKAGLLNEEESPDTNTRPTPRTEATHQGRLFDAKLPSCLRSH